MALVSDCVKARDPHTFSHGFFPISRRLATLAPTTHKAKGGRPVVTLLRTNGGG